MKDDFKMENNFKSYHSLSYNSADLRSHQVMVGQLSSSFPGVNIISEETGNNIKDIEQVKFHLINKAEMIGELRDLRTNRHVALSEITIWVDPLGSALCNCFKSIDCNQH